MVSQKILIDNDSQCAWYAYYEGMTEVVVPSCPKCGSYIKLTKEGFIPQRPDRGCQCEIGYAKKLSAPLNEDGMLSQYKLDTDTNEVSESLPFTLLPTQGMTIFGLINGPRKEAYAFDLKTGDLIINGVPLGMGVIARNNRNPQSCFVPISDRKQSYGDGGDLIFFKRAKAAIGGDMAAVMYYNIGYKCKVDSHYYTTIVTVDATKGFKPYITTKYSESM